MLDVLLVDDEPSIRLSVGDALQAAGYRVTLAADGGEAAELIATRVFDVVVSDIRLPKLDGLSLFRRIRAESPSTDVILITAYGRVSDAVQALKEGARDYLTKPFDNDEICLRVAAAADRRNLQRELENARAELASRSGPALIGRSPTMARLGERISTMAGSHAPVLITGESGTGKELVAKSLHELSPRRKGPFVAVNCAAFPDTLLEAEFFGHERGAFTGAVKKRDGRFKAADGGTLFLDEVGEISLPAQAKLLRVLQEGAFEPIGTNTQVQVDVRVVSATNRNLKDRVAEGRFREDLYYRLKVLDISIPPLRDRQGDLPILVEHFMKRLGATPGTGFSTAAWSVLTHYPFPGNVRELEHAIEHAVVLSHGREIGVEHLPSDMVAAVTASVAPAAGEAAATGSAGLEALPAAGPVRPLAVALKEFERAHLLQALTASGGRKTKAAEILGISRKNLWEKLRGHGIGDSDEE
jgi:two-component system response regulator AtoC